MRPYARLEAIRIDNDDDDDDDDDNDDDENNDDDDNVLWNVVENLKHWYV